MPGPVIIPGHGKIDLSRTDLDVKLIKQLYENDCHYFQITPLGLSEFYGIPEQPTSNVEPGIETPNPEPLPENPEPVPGTQIEPIEIPKPKRLRKSKPKTRK